MAKQPGFVGDILARRLKWMLYREGAGCNCEATRRRMNELGPEGCRREFESLIAEMKQNAHDSKQLWSETGARWMLNWAIRTAEKCQAEVENEAEDLMGVPMPRGMGSECRNGLRGVFLNPGEFDYVLNARKEHKENAESNDSDPNGVTAGAGDRQEPRTNWATDPRTEEDPGTGG